MATSFWNARAALLAFGETEAFVILIPGACIFFLIYAINNLGEFLRDRLDVRFSEVRKW